MTTIATHMRMTGLSVSNEDVDSRKAAVATLKTAWAKLRQADDIIVKAGQVARALGGDGTPPSDLGEEVETAVQAGASAFLYVDHPLEVGIVAGVATEELLRVPPGTSGWQVADIWAASIWSALGFQPVLDQAKRETLRSSVSTLARQRSLSGAEAARERSQVDDFGKFAVAADDAEAADAEADAFKRATSATIEALRKNAALDREELDFLWWSQLGRSRILDRPLPSIPEAVRLVTAGIEGAGYLRRFPCEVHRDLVLRTLNANPVLTLEELMAAIGDDRALLSAPYRHGIVAQAPNVFPLLHALVTGEASGPGAELGRPAAEWGGRALLEAGLVHVRGTGPGRL